MSGGGSDDQGNGRQPKDMKGLLKFCMENTRAEDAPASGTFRELSPEVMSAMCIIATVQSMYRQFFL